ncbi:MAG TPA: DUF4412 domain-containing protein [Bacteroidetes bacterium]|nr:DUF4412 domain-containing protein [Bacteroidota bacterium]
MLLKSFSIFPIMLASFLLPEFLAAQTTALVIRQRNVEIRYDMSDTLALPAAPASDIAALRALLPEMPLTELIALAEKRGLEVSINNSKAIFADEQFRLDMQAPFGRTSLIFTRSDSVLYNVLWPQKRYIAQSMRYRRKLRQSVSGGLDSLRTLVERLQGDDMETAEQPGLLSHKPESTVSHVRMQDERHVNGFSCSRFEKNSPGLQHTVWATRDVPGLTQDLHLAADRFSDVFGARAGKTASARFRHDWPDWLPVRTVALQTRRSGQAILIVEDVLSIRKTQVADSMFAVPADFREASFFDLLNTNMGK